MANRAIKVNSAMPASSPFSLGPFLAVPRVLAKNFFVEFTKLIVWRRPMFSWLYAQLEDHLAISCLTCNSSREIAFSLLFSMHLFVIIVTKRESFVKFIRANGKCETRNRKKRFSKYSIRTLNSDSVRQL